MRAGWGEGVRPSRKNEQKGTFQPGMKTPNSTKSRAAQCILESYVALLMRMCIAGAGTTSVTITWTNVQVGTNYVLQYNTNVATATWSNLAPVTAAGTTASQTDNPPAGSAARFYRVLKP